MESWWDCLIKEIIKQRGAMVVGSNPNPRWNLSKGRYYIEEKDIKAAKCGTQKILKSDFITFFSQKISLKKNPQDDWFESWDNSATPEFRWTKATVPAATVQTTTVGKRRKRHFGVGQVGARIGWSHGRVRKFKIFILPVISFDHFMVSVPVSFTNLDPDPVPVPAQVSDSAKAKKNIQ